MLCQPQLTSWADLEFRLFLAGFGLCDMRVDRCLDVRALALLAESQLIEGSRKIVDRQAFPVMKKVQHYRVQYPIDLGKSIRGCVGRWGAASPVAPSAVSIPCSCCLTLISGKATQLLQLLLWSSGTRALSGPLSRLLPHEFVSAPLAPNCAPSHTSYSANVKFFN
jgi:hypothetical protein